MAGAEAAEVEDITAVVGTVGNGDRVFVDIEADVEGRDLRADLAMADLRMSLMDASPSGGSGPSRLTHVGPGISLQICRSHTV